MSSTRKHLTIGEQTLAYTLRKSSRAKRMRITIHRDGSVVATMPVRGHEAVLERFICEKAAWICGKIASFQLSPHRSVVHYGRRHYLKHKESARTLVVARVAYYSNIYGFAVNRISIRNQKTRWGSCSKNGSLNFNYKIVFLPEALVDYIIVHELCHLKEFNHSKRFWGLVGDIIPEYNILRKELISESFHLSYL